LGGGVPRESSKQSGGMKSLRKETNGDWSRALSLTNYRKTQDGETTREISPARSGCSLSNTPGGSAAACRIGASQGGVEKGENRDSRGRDVSRGERIIGDLPSGPTQARVQIRKFIEHVPRPIDVENDDADITTQRRVVGLGPRGDRKKARERGRSPGTPKKRK